MNNNMCKDKIFTLIIIGSSILGTFGILSNNSNLTLLLLPAFSQESGTEVIITIGAADDGNSEPFAPRAINVMPGSIVSWTNEDSTTHTVTSDEGGLFDADQISPSDTFENVFDMPGEFGYHCEIHPWMTGRVIVG
jgi:plastocyanin